MESFEKLGLGKGLLQIIADFKFDKPTEIQESTIPLILEGKDLIGKAATGSGKTLAFGAPIIQKVIPGKKVQALILAPTRELAEQITKMLRKFAKHYDLTLAEVYGGVGINPQIRALEKAEIVVGTPGRILDHLNRRTLNLKNLNYLVLDEADRMADMGFLPDVEKIIMACPREKQTLLFSATLSPDITHIERKYMHSPAHVIVESYVDRSKLTQIFYDVPSFKKLSLLVHLLKEDKSNLVMVFSNTRRNAEYLSKALRLNDIDSIAIHGGLTQQRRNRVMQEFHSGRFRILICTDVAARGLDIKNVTHIYNYDLPTTSNDYIHRIGRTARAGADGEAISLVSQQDYENLRKIMLDDSLKIKKETLPDFPQANAPVRNAKTFKPRDRGQRHERPRRFGGNRNTGARRQDGRQSGRRLPGRTSRRPR